MNGAPTWQGVVSALALMLVMGALIAWMGKR